MPNVTVLFTISAGPGVTAYWIAVGGQDIPLVNGTGPAALATGQKHRLIWWFTGPGGSKLAIQGKRGNAIVVDVKDSMVPAGESEGAGTRKFDL